MFLGESQEFRRKLRPRCAARLFMMRWAGSLCLAQQMGLLCSPASAGQGLKKKNPGDLRGLSGVQRYSKTPSPFHI